MVQPIKPALRLSVRIGGIVALLFLPFALPPLKHSCTARLLAPPLEEPMSTSDLVSEFEKWQSISRWNSFWQWVNDKSLFELQKIRTKMIQKTLNDELTVKDFEAALIIENLYDYTITEPDKDFVRSPYHLNYKLTVVLLKHKDYIIEKEDIDIARSNKNTLFAWAATQNESYLIELEDIKIYKESPHSMFAQGLELNPGLKEALEKYTAEASYP